MKPKGRLVLTIGLLLGGCAAIGAKEIPASPSAPWKAPEAEHSAGISLDAAKKLPIDAAQLNRNWTLPELIDLALSNNTRTQRSWLSTKAAAAALGSARGDYYPQLSTGLEYDNSKQNVKVQNTPSGRATVTTIDNGAFGAVDYVLYDFGQRSAKVDEFKHDLVAANYAHNAALQDVIFQVQQAYYGYVAYKALAKSQTQSVDEARTNLNAAQERHKAGLATIADVLQAQTALSQAELTLNATQGQIKVVRGIVATAVGVPPTSPLDVNEPLSSKLPVDVVSASVEELISTAEQKSPVLSQARALVAKADSTLEKVKAEGWPTIGATGRWDELHGSGDWYGNYAATVGLSFPLFTGFSHSYDVIKAKTDKQLAETQLKDTWQQRSLAIWSSYTDYKTAVTRIRTATVLVASATESHAVAYGRYKEGVGSILDLLAAQSALENARSAMIKAKADWLISLAQLKRDVGLLESADSANFTQPLEAPAENMTHSTQP